MRRGDAERDKRCPYHELPEAVGKAAWTRRAGGSLALIVSVVHGRGSQTPAACLHLFSLPYDCLCSMDCGRDVCSAASKLSDDVWQCIAQFLQSAVLGRVCLGIRAALRSHQLSLYDNMQKALPASKCDCDIDTLKVEGPGITASPKAMPPIARDGRTLASRAIRGTGPPSSPRLRVSRRRLRIGVEDVVYLRLQNGRRQCVYTDARVLVVLDSTPPRSPLRTGAGPVANARRVPAAGSVVGPRAVAEWDPSRTLLGLALHAGIPSRRLPRAARPTAADVALHFPQAKGPAVACAATGDARGRGIVITQRPGTCPPPRMGLPRPHGGAPRLQPLTARRVRDLSCGRLVPGPPPQAAPRLRAFTLSLASHTLCTGGVHATVALRTTLTAVALHTGPHDAFAALPGAPARTGPRMAVRHTATERTVAFRPRTRPLVPSWPTRVSIGAPVGGQCVYTDARVLVVLDSTPPRSPLRTGAGPVANARRVPAAGSVVGPRAVAEWVSRSPSSRTPWRPGAPPLAAGLWRWPPGALRVALEGPVAAAVRARRGKADARAPDSWSSVPGLEAWALDRDEEGDGGGQLSAALRHLASMIGPPLELSGGSVGAGGIPSYLGSA